MSRITIAASIVGAMAAAFVGPAVYSILQSGQQQWPQWTICFLGIGVVLFIVALLILVPHHWWVNVRNWCARLPKKILTIYMWKRYGPTYSLDKLSLQQPLSNHEDTYKAIISLHVKNRDDDSLKVHFSGARFRFQQQLRRKRLLVTLTPTPGFPWEQEIAPHKEGNYEVPLIGFSDDADYLNLNRPYQWEIWGIAIELEGIGRRSLSKKGSSISERN